MTEKRLLPIILSTALTGMLVVASAGRAQSDSEATPEAVSSSGETDARQAVDARERENKRRTAQAGLLTLCLIIAVFVCLIVTVMLWARRTRRMINEPFPDQKASDPLWYLRGRGTPSSETSESIVDGAGDEGSPDPNEQES